MPSHEVPGTDAQFSDEVRCHGDRGLQVHLFRRKLGPGLHLHAVFTPNRSVRQGRQLFTEKTGKPTVISFGPHEFPKPEKYADIIRADTIDAFLTGINKFLDSFAVDDMLRGQADALFTRIKEFVHTGSVKGWKTRSGRHLRW